MLIAGLVLGATGCTSIYHRSRSELPPDATSELKLRLSEAGRAEGLVRKAGRTLLKDLQSQRPAAILQIGFDRLEAAAYDLDRRVLAARDTAGLLNNPAASVEELDRLRVSADAWLAYIRDYRTTSPAAQLEHLKALLAR